MTVSDVLSGVARSNLAFALATLGVLALRPAILKIAGARIRYGLWLLPLAAAAAALLPAMHIALPAPAVHGVDSSALGEGDLFLNGAAALAPPLKPVLVIPWRTVLIALWFSGAAVGAGLTLLRQVAFLRKARNGQLGPAVIGFQRPRIHLPKHFHTQFSAEERALIVAHERAHMSRQDARTNGLWSLASCVFWFNPMVHLAAWLARQDQEMACDETVLADFPEQRKTYAEALLKTQLTTSPLPLGCYWPSRSALPLESRIKRLGSAPPSLVNRVMGGVTIILTTLCGGLVAWSARTPQIDYVAAKGAPLKAAAATLPAAHNRQAGAQPTAPVRAGALRPGQRVRITVKDEPEFTIDRPIGADGRLMVSDASIKAAGMTSRQLAQAVAAKLKFLLTKPPVVEVSLPPSGFGAADIQGAISRGDPQGAVSYGASATQVLAAMQTKARAGHDQVGLDALNQLAASGELRLLANPMPPMDFGGNAGHFTSSIMLASTGAVGLSVWDDPRQLRVIQYPAGPAGSVRPAVQVQSAPATTIPAAIKAGDVAQVMRLGGSPMDVVNAEKAILARDPGAPVSSTRPDIPLSRWMASTDEYIASGRLPVFIQDNGRTVMAFPDATGQLRSFTTVPGMNGPGLTPVGRAYHVPSGTDGNLALRCTVFGLNPDAPKTIAEAIAAGDTAALEGLGGTRADAEAARQVMAVKLKDPNLTALLGRQAAAQDREQAFAARSAQQPYKTALSAGAPPENCAEIIRTANHGG